ncbi:MAG: hypothetical protein ABIF01_03460 [Candidatus Micrarchaeota archaeon]
MGPPVDEKYIGSIRAGLTGIMSQAEAIMLEEGAAVSSGPDYSVIGIAAAVIVGIGVVYWLFSSGKIKTPFTRARKTPEGEKPASAGKVGEGGAPKTSAGVSDQTVAQYRVRLSLRGGAYRTKVRSIVKDKEGKPVPDGTVVKFRADSGIITPSGITKDGMAYASMAFKEKPKHVTVSVAAVGVERKIRIDFV